MASMKTKIQSLMIKNPRLGSICYELMRLAGHGGSIKRFLKNIRSKGFYPKSILDVGANRGEWSRNAKSVFKDAQFFLVEPQIELKPFLDKFCAKAPGSKLFPAAAGAEIGELTLSISPDSIGSSFLTPEHLKTAGKCVEQRRVPVVTIDSLIQQHDVPIPDLVKLDVEGFELEVLTAATKCFGNTEVFILEVAFFPYLPELPLFDEIHDFMLHHGYVVYDVVGLKRRAGILGRADIAFAKKDGMLRARAINGLDDT